MYVHLSKELNAKAHLDEEVPAMNSKISDRRVFLKRSAALAGLAAFANSKALASVALLPMNPTSRICYMAVVPSTRML
jgi:hypothetical protein